MRKIFFVLLALMTLSACVNKSVDLSRPNIIYILADDLGYGDVSRFNPQGKIKTPNLDQLASEGLIFTDAHTTSSVCTPTRYGILTGRYNWRTTLKSSVLTGKSKALVPTTRTTIASLLKQKGYQTAFLGKWHLGWDWTLEDPNEFGGDGWHAEDFDNVDFSKPISHTPNDLGFDYHYAHAGSLDMAPYVYVENGKVTAIPNRHTVDSGAYSWWRQGPTGADFIHEDVTPNFFRRAETYITEKSKSNDPFFLYLALPSPHTPILPTEAWHGKSDLLPYADFVMMVDDYVGKLMKAIKVAGIEDNTLIIFTSDNGCAPYAGIKELQEMGHYPGYIYRGSKSDIFEGGHRVPFIAKWPAKIKKGRESNQLVCTTDLMATFADIVGYTLHDDEGEDSFSMMPLFNQNDAPIREAVVHHSAEGVFAIRKNEWKLIFNAGSGGWSFPNAKNDKDVIDTLPSLQLYNLKTDPGETTNKVESYPELITELKLLMAKYIEDGRSTPGKPQQNDPIDFEWEQIQLIK